MSSRPFQAPAPVVAIVNWLVPGAGYLLLGQVARGLTIGFTILILFVLGILIGGIHVVDPPVLTGAQGHIARTILEKPWYIGQFLTGIIGLICGWLGPTQPASHARVNDIGTLYTAIAGMLNLLATIDSAYRSTIDDAPHDAPRSNAMNLLLLLAYTPFIQPLPRAWDYWYVWLLPLCAAVSIVWKSIKCPSMKSVPREAAVIFVTILAGMIIAAAVLVALVKLMV